MIDILRYPWDRIYTTNYDNAIELALTRAHKSHRQLNNLDAPPQTAPHGVPVVYLHGRAESWTDDDNYKRSCLLTAESYNNPLEKLGPWAQRLQDDYDRAQLFVFIGFSASDLHQESACRWQPRRTPALLRQCFPDRRLPQVGAVLAATPHLHGRPQELVKGKKDYLENSCTRADEFDARLAKGKKKYDRSHIDDRKAKFLMQRGLSEPFRPALVRDITDSCELTGRLFCGGRT